MRRKLEESIGFKGSEKKVRYILELLGFLQKAAENSGKILTEKTEIRQERIHYLKCSCGYRTWNHMPCQCK
jgi:hypothetical protein